MPQPATHIIHKLNLEIEVPGERMARRMYDQAGRLLQEHVLPMLENMLKEYEDGLHIRMDTLSLNLDAATADDLEETIRQQLAVAIKQHLEQTLKTGQEINHIREDAEGKAKDLEPGSLLNKSDTIKISTGPQQLVEAFLFFLENGTAPWWMADTAPLTRSQELVNAIAQQEERFVASFLHKAGKKGVMLERLRLQYDSLLLVYIFSLIAPLEILSLALKKEEELPSILGASQLTEEHRQQYWSVVWQLFSINDLPSVAGLSFGQQLEAGTQPYIKKYKASGESSKAEDLFNDSKERLLSAMLDDNIIVDKEMLTSEEDIRSPLEKSKDSVAEKRAQEHESRGQGRIVLHAGLILLHPYLQYFFMELGMMNGTQFKNDRSRDRAIHLLHYIATGNEQAPDFNLVFEKYLCGIDSAQTTYRYTRLTNQMKEEAASLLDSVIRNWPVLKNTSPDGLREGFLQRKGKLQIIDKHHKLLMERQALDILLEQLPWNIALVKLPWHDHMIHVEWT